MFVPPNFASLAIFSNNHSQPHAGATITSLAGGTKFYQSSAQFIAVRSNRNGLRRRACTILWRNDETSSVGPLLITSILIISVAMRPRLALCRDGRAGCTTDDSTGRRSPAAS